MALRVGIYIFENFQLLDMSGPVSAFELANLYKPDSYEIFIISSDPGLIRSSSGVSVVSTFEQYSNFDTFIVVGGPGISDLTQSETVISYVKSVALSSRRVASVCSGAFLLAAAGLLDGFSATTHWRRAKELKFNYPNVNVNSDSIYICNGNIWTSAGITAGIDLTLALISQDLGNNISLNVAKELVMYFTRPGGYSQQSCLLTTDSLDGIFIKLICWIREHLAESITVESLASHIGMSSRNFSRVFSKEMGITPAKLVQKIRLEVALDLVENSNDSFEKIAFNTGFKSAARMRDTFLRVFNESPQSIRRRKLLSTL